MIKQKTSRLERGKRGVTKCLCLVTLRYARLSGSLRLIFLERCCAWGRDKEIANAANGRTCVLGGRCRQYGATNLEDVSERCQGEALDRSIDRWMEETLHAFTHGSLQNRKYNLNGYITARGEESHTREVYSCEHNVGRGRFTPACMYFLLGSSASYRLKKAEANNANPPRHQKDKRETKLAGDGAECSSRCGKEGTALALSHPRQASPTAPGASAQAQGSPGIHASLTAAPALFLLLLLPFSSRCSSAFL